MESRFEVARVQTARPNSGLWNKFSKCNLASKAFFQFSTQPSWLPRTNLEYDSGLYDQGIMTVQKLP
jgi:hypothetical protein